MSTKELKYLLISKIDDTEDEQLLKAIYTLLNSSTSQDVFMVNEAQANSIYKGKKNIEQAIEQEPNNAELRFIRLSVQKNAPTFLEYHSNIKEDIQFIKNNRSQIKSNVINQYIESLLKN